MITVTDLCDYVWCPYQVYLKKVKKIRPPPTPQMVRGTVIHSIKEEVSKRERILVSSHISEGSSLDEIRKCIFDNAMRCAKNVILKERQGLEAQGVDPMALLSELKSDFHYESIASAARLKRLIERIGLGAAIEMTYPEQEAEFVLEDKELDLRGRIDCFEQVGGMSIPIDYKSGNMHEDVTPSQRMQISAYAVMMERSMNTKVPLGIIEYTNFGRLRPVIVDDEAKEDVYKTLEAVKRIVYGKEEPEKNIGKRCNYCSFKEYCI